MRAFKGAGGGVEIRSGIAGEGKRKTNTTGRGKGANFKRIDEKSGLREGIPAVNKNGTILQEETVRQKVRS